VYFDSLSPGSNSTLLDFPPPRPFHLWVESSWISFQLHGFPVQLSFSLLPSFAERGPYLEHLPLAFYFAIPETRSSLSRRQTLPPAHLLPSPVPTAVPSSPPLFFVSSVASFPNFFFIPTPLLGPLILHTRLAPFPSSCPLNTFGKRFVFRVYPFPPSLS